MNNVFQTMPLNRKVCGLLLLACFSFATTKDSIAATPVKKEKSVEILGQIFIVKKDGNSVKLALVSVSAFPEKEVYGNIQKTRGMVIEKAKQLVASHDEAKKLLASATEKSSSAEMKYVWERELKDSSAGSYEKFTSAGNVFASAKLEAAKAASAVRTIENELKAQLSTASFLEGLSKPTDAVKTDADGKFVLTVPPGNYVLNATAKRLAGNSTEVYEWMVKTDVRKGKQNIMLSNDNLFQFDEACRECVLIKIAD